MRRTGRKKGSGSVGKGVRTLKYRTYQIRIKFCQVNWVYLVGWTRVNYSPRIVFSTPWLYNYWCDPVTCYIVTRNSRTKGSRPRSRFIKKMLYSYSYKKEISQLSSQTLINLFSDTCSWVRDLYYLFFRLMSGRVLVQSVEKVTRERTGLGHVMSSGLGW